MVHVRTASDAISAALKVDALLVAMMATANAYVRIERIVRHSLALLQLLHLRISAAASASLCVLIILNFFSVG